MKKLKKKKDKAQMEDKGVGLIDQAAPAPMQGLA